jgi:hypothetical protein
MLEIIFIGIDKPKYEFNNISMEIITEATKTNNIIPSQIELMVLSQELNTE